MSVVRKVTLKFTLDLQHAKITTPGPQTTTTKKKLNMHFELFSHFFFITGKCHEAVT